MSRDESYSRWSALPFPLATLIMAYILWRSTILTMVRGVEWGGPPVPLSELRKARVRSGQR